MSRIELIQCDACGRVFTLKGWSLRDRRFIIIPQAYKYTGGSWFDVCTPECEDVLRSFAQWLFGGNDEE